MAGPILYSTNPWMAHEIAVKYRAGVHFVWCSEYFDPAFAPPGSAGSAIAPSSSPRGILDTLKVDCEREERHSALIKNYRKTFCRLAAEWLAGSEIDKPQYDELMATVKAPSWRIWRPLLYVIPRAPLDTAGRIVNVPHRARAGYGPELQIVDLMPDEFDIIEFPLR